MGVVALVAHADDELMCAGTLARFVDKGHPVRLVVGFCSDFGPNGGKEGQRATRIAELQASAGAIGCDLVPVMLEDESSFCWSQTWVQFFEQYTGQPDVLISHHPDDHNTSHGHFGRIAQTIARKNRTTLWQIDQSLPGGLTGRAPNLLVNISAQWPRKAKALLAYRSQLDKYPGLDLAISRRDHYLGWACGVDRAEGFTVDKAVWL
jgi:LmbE family N-acetylglucosaminyl deacetylase